MIKRLETDFEKKLKEANEKNDKLQEEYDELDAENLVLKGNHDILERENQDLK